MKHIKSYEHTNEDDYRPQLGDYIIINLYISPDKYVNSIDRKLVKYFANTVGQLIKTRTSERYIKYTTKPDAIIRKYFTKENDNSWLIWTSKASCKIVSFGKTPEEAESKTIATKYNL